MTTTTIRFEQIATADLNHLNDELAAAGQESTHTSIYDARYAVACLLLDVADLELVDSETGDVVSHDVTEEQAGDSAQTPEGYIDVDGRRCYVRQAD